MATHEAVSTGGSPWRVEVDGAVQAGTHDDLHKAVARGYRILVDQPAADVRVRREAEIRLALDLGASEPAPEPAPEPTPGVDEVLSVTELASTVEVVVAYDPDAAASVQVAAWRGPDLPNISLTDPPNPATLPIPRESVDVETRIAVVRFDTNGAFVDEVVLDTIIVPALAGAVDPDPDPAPSPTPTPTGALVVDDPDSFSSSAEVRANGYDRTSIIHLDTQVARPGGTQSIRYDFVDQGVDQPIHAGRRLAFGKRVKEVWIETQLRWSTNFMAIQNPPGGTWTFGHKLLFGDSRTQNAESWKTSGGASVGRWSLVAPGGGSGNPPHSAGVWESPVLDDGSANINLANYDISQLFDELWHTFRFHWRHDPGLYVLEIDGVKIIEASGFVVHPEVAIIALLLGRNKDDGIESGTESLWWGRTWASTEDPGW